MAHTLMTVYVHFNRFIELTINPHTNLYNLASRKPRLLRALDPLVPYNYCFWSPWLWDVSLAEEMNEEGWGGTSKLDPCRIQTLHRFLRIHNSTDEGPRLHIKHALTRSLFTLIGQQQDGYPCGGQVTAGAHIKPGANNSHTRPMSRRFYGPV